MASVLALYDKRLVPDGWASRGRLLLTKDSHGLTFEREADGLVALVSKQEGRPEHVVVSLHAVELTDEQALDVVSLFLLPGYLIESGPVRWPPSKALLFMLAPTP